MINKFTIGNGAKFFSLGIFQNYLVFRPAKNTLNILLALLRLNRGNLMECQKKESIENTTQPASNFAPVFVDHHLLPDIDFNNNVQ